MKLTTPLFTVLALTLCALGAYSRTLEESMAIIDQKLIETGYLKTRITGNPKYAQHAKNLEQQHLGSAKTTPNGNSTSSAASSTGSSGSSSSASASVSSGSPSTSGSSSYIVGNSLDQVVSTLKEKKWGEFG